MSNSKYHLHLGDTEVYRKIIMEATKGIGQRDIKGATEDCFFYIWFSSKKSEEDAMVVGADMIGVGKTNTKGFCKYTIENLKKCFPVGSYLMLRSKPMVTGGRRLICIGYKYNKWVVMYFVFTDEPGRTNAGIHYLSK